MEITGQEKVKRHRPAARRPLAAVICVFLAWILVHAIPAVAGAYQPALTQYAHTAWRVQDGDFDGQASTIAQTADGYLWVGTEGGLERYDGARFRHWLLPKDGTVYAVLADRDGTLWVGLGPTLYHLKSGVPVGTIQVRGRVNQIYQDPAGAIWLVRSRSPAHEGALCKVVGTNVQCFGVAQGQPCDYGGSLVQAPTGAFLIGTAAGVCRWRPVERGELTKLGPGVSNLTAVTSLQLEQDGSVLIGFLQAGEHMGLQRMSAAGVTPYKSPGLDGRELHVLSILRGRDGALWIGTAATGIYHVDHGRVDHFNRTDGLSGADVNAIFEDREGDVWIATSGGLDRFHPHAVSAITTREGLSTETANSVLAKRDGSIWIGANDGLNIIRDGAIVTPPTGFSGHQVNSMVEDHAGRVWLGLDEELVVFDGRKLRTVRTPEGGKVGAVVGLVEDAGHDIWVLCAGRPYLLYRVRGNGPAEQVPVPDGRDPRNLAVGPDGSIWTTDTKKDLEIYRAGKWALLKGPDSAAVIGDITVTPSNLTILSTTAGADLLARGGWIHFDKPHGLPCDVVISATVGLDGALWLRTQCGLVSIARADLEHALGHPRDRLKLRWLDSTDGAQPGETSFTPRGAVSRDGQLWFATDNVLLTVDPAHLTSNVLPPPVHIEELVADHHTYGVGRAVELPPRTRDVEIAYSGLSFIAPQKTRFRYRLSGIDSDWQDVGTRRTAFYMNLKPGRYRFQVIASNNDGVWNETGDGLEFSIRPTFFQTLWFQALAVALFIGLIWLGVWLRVRYVTAEIETRLSERQAERMRIARELHDTLLQGVQGLILRFQAVADRLPHDHKTRTLMDDALNRADAMIIEGRQRVHDLRIRRANGRMDENLHDLGEDMAKDSDAVFRLTVEGHEYPLREVVRDEVEAIATEAIRNAFQHANAKAIEVVLGYQDAHFRIGIRDDGRGIPEEIASSGKRTGHFGLEGMRERAARIGARLSVASGPGKGTEIFLEVPVSLATGMSKPLRLSDRLKALIRKLTLLQAED